MIVSSKKTALLTIHHPAQSSRSTLPAVQNLLLLLFFILLLFALPLPLVLHRHAVLGLHPVPFVVVVEGAGGGMLVALRAARSS